MAYLGGSLPTVRGIDKVPDHSSLKGYIKTGKGLDFDLETQFEDLHFGRELFESFKSLQMLLSVLKIFLWLTITLRIQSSLHHLTLPVTQCLSNWLPHPLSIQEELKYFVPLDYWA